MRHIFEELEACDSGTGRIDERAMDHIAVVTSHLFAGRDASGVFLPVGELEDGLVKCYRELQKQSRQDTASEGEDEGVVKELQAVT